MADQSKKGVNLKEFYKTYINTLKVSRIIPDDLKIGQLKGGALPVFPLEKTYANRVLLCGDAAGFINPLTGEGIYYAMSSGEIAAEVITEALEIDDTDEKFLSKYQKIWKNDFGDDIKLLLSSTRRWQIETEKFIKLASRDKKLAGMALDILQGRLSIHECKWKLIRRYLYVNFKELFRK